MPALGWPPPSSLPPVFPALIRNLSSSGNQRPAGRWCTAGQRAGDCSLSCRLEPARTPLARMRGLMFRPRPAALLFTFDWAGRHAIHSFFVGFAFDAVYLDENGRVADLFVSVPPFSPPLSSRSPARYLLELPAGSARRLSIHIGDLLSIQAR